MTELSEAKAKLASFLNSKQALVCTTDHYRYANYPTIKNLLPAQPGEWIEVFLVSGEWGMGRNVSVGGYDKTPRTCQQEIEGCFPLDWIRKITIGVNGDYIIREIVKIVGSKWNKPLLKPALLKLYHRKIDAAKKSWDALNIPPNTNPPLSDAEILHLFGITEARPSSKKSERKKASSVNDKSTVLPTLSNVTEPVPPVPESPLKVKDNSNVHPKLPGLAPQSPKTPDNNKMIGKLPGLAPQSPKTPHNSNMVPTLPGLIEDVPASPLKTEQKNRMSDYSSCSQATGSTAIESNITPSVGGLSLANSILSPINCHSVQEDNIDPSHTGILADNPFAALLEEDFPSNLTISPSHPNPVHEQNVGTSNAVASSLPDVSIPIEDMLEQGVFDEAQPSIDPVLTPSHDTVPPDIIVPTSPKKRWADYSDDSDDGILESMIRDIEN